MKNKDLIKELTKLNQEDEVIIFAEGKIYPTLAIQCFDNKIEIGCGWQEIFEEDEE